MDILHDMLVPYNCDNCDVVVEVPYNPTNMPKSVECGDCAEYRNSPREVETMRSGTIALFRAIFQI